MKNAGYYAAWAIIIMILLQMLTGCYSEKKADKALIKAQTKYPERVASLCSSFYPPIESVKDSISFLPGKTIYRSDTTTVHDTATNETIRYINNEVYIHDTIEHTHSEGKVDKAGMTALQILNGKLKEKIASLQTTNTYLTWCLVILAVYTLLRWIVRYFFKFNIP